LQWIFLFKDETKNITSKVCQDDAQKFVYFVTSDVKGEKMLAQERNMLFFFGFAPIEMWMICILNCKTGACHIQGQ